MTQPFQFANGQLAHSAEDLLKLCQQFPADGINYLIREDLEKWLTYIGQEDIARCAANARQTPLEDRQKLEEFLTKCHSLSSPQTKIPPETSQPTVVEEKPVEETQSEVVEEKPTEASQPTVVEEKPVETAKLDRPNVVEETPIPTAKAVVSETSTAKTESKPTNSNAAKPSFFRAIAKLIVNVLYRNKD